MVMDTSDCGDAEAWLAAYDDYLHRMLGAAKATRVRYLRTARRFVGACLGSASAPWAGLSVAQVTAFIQQETASKSGHGRAAPACAVRPFLRFLACVSISLIPPCVSVHSATCDGFAFADLGVRRPALGGQTVSDQGCRLGLWGSPVKPASIRRRRTGPR